MDPQTIPDAMDDHGHKNVLGFKGSTDAGIYLERAPNGTVAKYILELGKPLSLQQRLAKCRETAEAVAWIHAYRVLYYDIQPTNLLLDKDLHVKLSDFQGKLLAKDGIVLVDGYSIEPYRFSLPRDDGEAREEGVASGTAGIQCRHRDMLEAAVRTHGGRGSGSRGYRTGTRGVVCRVNAGLGVWRAGRHRR